MSRSLLKKNRTVMMNIIKYFVIGCFVFSCNYGLSQCNCDDIKIIELKDTTISGQAYFTLKLTSDSSNCSTGYSDFWFVDQLGDTINQWTGFGMWLPNASNPMFDTTAYKLQLNPGYSIFPKSFSGNFYIRNPNCTIPFNYAVFSSVKKSILEAGIDFFPNPATDAIQIVNKSALSIASIKFYDTNGKFVATDNMPAEVIGISTLIPGVYFVKIQSNDGTVAVKKLIKN